jgi:hypothetical protein
MMDFASIQARPKRVSLTSSREEGHTEAIAARPPKVAIPPTTDGVDKIYHQLVEIHALTAAQLAECARWRRSNPTSNAAHASGDWRGPTMESSTMRTVPLPLTDFSPHASLPQRGPRVEPQAHRWAHQSAVQPEHRARNPHHESGAHDVSLMLPFQPPTDTVRNATEELRSVVT